MQKYPTQMPATTKAEEQDNFLSSNLDDDSPSGFLSCDGLPGASPQGTSSNGDSHEPDENSPQASDPLYRVDDLTPADPLFYVDDPIFFSGSHYDELFSSDDSTTHSTGLNRQPWCEHLYGGSSYDESDYSGKSTYLAQLMKGQFEATRADQIVEKLQEFSQKMYHMENKCDEAQQTSVYQVTCCQHDEDGQLYSLEFAGQLTSLHPAVSYIYEDQGNSRLNPDSGPNKEERFIEQCNQGLDKEYERIHWVMNYLPTGFKELVSVLALLGALRKLKEESDCKCSPAVIQALVLMTFQRTQDEAKRPEYLSKVWQLLTDADLRSLETWKQDEKQLEIEGWNEGTHTSLQITTKDIQIHVGKEIYWSVVQDLAGDRFHGVSQRQKDRHRPVGRWAIWTPEKGDTMICVQKVPPQASGFRLEGTL